MTRLKTLFRWGNCIIFINDRTPTEAQFSNNRNKATWKLNEPFSWRKPRLVFVNSMSDFFHEKIPTAVKTMIWDVMVRNPQHKFQVLTKRPLEMKKFSSFTKDVLKGRHQKLHSNELSDKVRLYKTTKYNKNNLNTSLTPV